MAAIIIVTDLPAALQSQELINAMVAGANANASRVAPCLGWDGSDPTKPAPTEDQLAEARLVLIGAVKRWSEQGAGALSSQQAGPFSQSVDTRQRTGYNLWPSEIERLQGICKAPGEGGQAAFSITPSGGGTIHTPWCSYSLGALYCDCGAVLAGEPIYGV